MKYYLLASITLLFLASCGSEEETPPGTYAQGLLVINEGNFGAGNGSLSFIDSEGEVIQNAFALANNGLQPGDIVQSVHETEDLILLVVNNSNILYALDKGELSITYQIEGLSLPRYATSAGSLGYVSEWVSFSDPGRITSFDLATGEMIDRINVGFGADELLIFENQLYVSNSFESSISVIDLTNFTEVSTINTSPSPGKISEAADGALWVLCGGGFDADFNNANDGALQKISNTTI
ncbi:MAG: YVTN family beta-propeller protein, partial [Paraglaciecola sp.]